MPSGGDFIILVSQRKALRLKKQFPKISQLENGTTEISKKVVFAKVGTLTYCPVQC